MYIPEMYQHHDRTEIVEFISAHGFALLVSSEGGSILATHVPLIFEDREGRDILHGHISAENPQSLSLKDGVEVLAVFSGPHAYISSSWYDHENVPTWNYTAVHVYGRVRLLDQTETLESLDRLMQKYEVASDNPVRLSELSQKNLRQARGVTAFEIAVTNIQSVRKLSQNRDDSNFERIIQKLQHSGDPTQEAVAAEMKKQRPK